MSGAIIAIGGTEFVMRAENEALHDYVLSQAEAPRPRVCLIPTASGEPREQIGAFHAAMDRRRCIASSVSLFRIGEHPIDLERHLPGQDVIYVTGGNMVNLMALWREHGLGDVLAAANAAGTVLCGYSAGSMCWFDFGVSRGAGKPAITRGLGLIAGSHCVHYSQDPERRATYRELVADGSIPAGIALDDHAAALFKDGRLVEAVISRQSSRAFRVERRAGQAAQTALEARPLDTRLRAPETALAEMRALRRLRSATDRR